MIDPRKPIPFRIAPTVFGRSKSTLYDWVTKGLLATTEGPEGRMVTLEAFQRAESKVQMGRPPGTATQK